MNALMGTGRFGKWYITVVMDERFILGLAISSSKGEKLETTAIAEANETLKSYGIDDQVDGVSKDRKVASFFGTLSLGLDGYEEAPKKYLEPALREYIHWYNYERIHSSISYQTPFAVWSRKYGIKG